MSQTRHGYNNEPIRALKFRSMTVMDGDNFTPVVRYDPRVTRLGRCLRRTNIDGLPQLFKVLAGDKSIVGPHPHAATAQNEGLRSANFVIFRSPEQLSWFSAARWARRPADEQAGSHPTKGFGS